MSETNPLAAGLLSKIEDQVERTLHLISLVPADKLEWKPQPDAFRLCEVLGHLLECLAGFCAALYVAKPNELSHFISLRDLTVNHCCGIDEARERIGGYLGCINQGFTLITDSDLSNRIPTVFVPTGETLLVVLLNNLEHLINHKHQLFSYLKLLGIGVMTADLYRLK
jgi:hypothetical protein